MAALLCGCTSTPRAPDVRLPAAFETKADATDVAALDRWWVLFGDPQLTTMVEQALATAPDARTALAVLDQARAVRGQAMAQYDPRGDLSGSATRQHNQVDGASVAAGQSGDSTTYNGAFSPSWEIGLFGRRRALRASADADLDTARFVYEASRQSLAADVATGLFQARGLAAQLADAQDAERIAGALADIGRLKVRADIGAAADQASLESDLATAKAKRLALAAELSAAKRSLLVLLGRGADPEDRLQIAPELGLPPIVPATTPGALLARRPDVREAEAKVRSAAGNQALDEMALLPTFTLTPSASRTKVTGDGGYATSLWSIGASIAVPVLDRPRLMAKIRGARAQSEQAVIAYEKAVQTAYGEAERTLTTYMADRERLPQLIQAEEMARYAFESRRAGYRAGVVDLTTLLSAEQGWRSAHTQAVQLRQTALTDAVGVYKALGGGWSPQDASSPKTR